MGLKAMADLLLPRQVSFLLAPHQTRSSAHTIQRMVPVLWDTDLPQWSSHSGSVQRGWQAAVVIAAGGGEDIWPAFIPDRITLPSVCPTVIFSLAN